MMLHDDLDEGSQQRREMLVALNMHCEIVQCPDRYTYSRFLKNIQRYILLNSMNYNMS